MEFFPLYHQNLLTLKRQRVLGLRSWRGEARLAVRTSPRPSAALPRGRRADLCGRPGAPKARRPAHGPQLTHAAPGSGCTKVWLPCAPQGLSWRPLNPPPCPEWLCHLAFYHIVAAHNRCPRDGCFMEQLDSCDPLRNRHGEKILLSTWTGSGFGSALGTTSLSKWRSFWVFLVFSLCIP